MNPDQHAVRLNYASPRIFFAREYRHRSANAALGIVALLLFTVFFGWGAYTGYRRTGSHWFSAPIAIMCGTTLFGAAWMIRRWWLNVDVPVTITEDGVTRGRKLWSWSQIASFSGDHAGPKRVSIIITVRGIHNEVGLMTTPPLTVFEFNDLVKRLSAELGERYPHVKFIPLPEDW